MTETRHISEIACTSHIFHPDFAQLFSVVLFLKLPSFEINETAIDQHRTSKLNMDWFVYGL